MKKKIEEAIWKLIETYCEENQVENFWLEPVVKFADA